MLISDSGSASWGTQLAINNSRDLGTLASLLLPLLFLFKNQWKMGAWEAQLVEHPTVDFSSGHDLRVLGWSPALGSALSRKSA